ncbi:arginine--tRNA ligase [Candidatus Saccharibacteria bacterium]|nr:arginine--tRNA ligase [Candidatus Saccharibacteria bacterium]
MDIKREIENELKKVLPSADFDGELVKIPTDKTKADYVSNVAFVLAKTLGKNPLELAEELATRVKSELFTASSERGFINFHLTDLAITQCAKQVVSAGKDFGKHEDLQGQIWEVEHTSPNPNKAMHIGHLRNNLVGMSIANLGEVGGAKVVRDWIDNNRGIAISMAMWAYERFHQNETPESLGLKPDHFVGQCYQEGSDAAKSDDKADREIRDMTVAWESGDEKTHQLWQKIIDWAHEGIFATLGRIGSRWDNDWHESDHYQAGKNLVDEGLKKSVFTRLDDGAILTKLEDYNIPNTIVQKSDGTSLYITQDLELTRLKKAEYSADKLFWVVGPEQTLALKQVFAVCEQLGIGKLEDFTHVPYGLVSFRDEDGKRKKISSRGGALSLDEILDEVKNYLLKQDRGYSEEKADAIGVAAVKFAMLKPGRTTDTVLDLKELTNLQGDSGVYVLYTRARILSVMRKIGETQDNGDFSWNEAEKNLVATVNYLPEIIKAATSELAPNQLVEFLIDVCRQFNSIYGNEKFITENEQETAKKLLLSEATLTAINTALDILGIEPVDQI